MRSTVIGLGLGVLLACTAWCLLSSGNQVFANRQLSQVEDPAGGLITHIATAGDRQVLTVIDPVARVVAVYHVDAVSGEVALKSVRDFRWDMHMVEFNGVSPLPREIRQMVGQQ